ncbi:hypothetical protein N4T77_20115 [Clostridium sp. CX1]|uniref:hypothetical protein n=1 Tax=Clostridium sp. CX1 TaxID=2978346 RepID=UPI0021C1D05B|nr:hypothetical protein [Clostridium sp. CX1]MCT8978884.1 hypothetical protein [Clostridium sp. CX1]
MVLVFFSMTFFIILIIYRENKNHKKIKNKRERISDSSNFNNSILYDYSVLNHSYDNNDSISSNDSCADSCDCGCDSGSYDSGGSCD